MLRPNVQSNSKAKSARERLVSYIMVPTWTRLFSSWSSKKLLVNDIRSAYHRSRPMPALCGFLPPHEKNTFGNWICPTFQVARCLVKVSWLTIPEKVVLTPCFVIWDRSLCYIQEPSSKSQCCTIPGRLIEIPENKLISQPSLSTMRKHHETPCSIHPH